MKWSTPAVFALALAGFVTQVAGSAQAAEPIAIGSRLEPLVDEFLIESLTGAALTLHPPVAREVAVMHDQPWEGNACCYHTVFRDGDRCRMYYRGSHHSARQPGDPAEVVCYAESTDGIHWTKPDLGLVAFRGSKQNNILWSGRGSHDFTPFLDTNPACKPDERYKAVACGTMGKGKQDGLFAFRSADAIHWSLLQEDPILTEGAFDSQNLAFWDGARQQYVEFHRGFRGGVRDIMTSTSTDFLHWTKPAWLDYPGSTPEHLYTNAIEPYCRAPQVYFGFPKRFVPNRKASEQVQHPGISDGVFMTSRDGRTFKRWSEALVRPGLQPERWIHRNNMTAWGILVTRSDLPGTPEELSIYSTENYTESHRQADSVRLRRFTQRLDGLVSVRADSRGGELLTRPLTFTGKSLRINFSTSAAGLVRIEIQDSQGRPIPGFSLQDCPEIFGDQIDRTVAWKQGSDLGRLAGQPIRLRVVLKDADLYAIQFP